MSFQTAVKRRIFPSMADPSNTPAADHASLDAIRRREALLAGELYAAGRRKSAAEPCGFGLVCSILFANASLASTLLIAAAVARQNKPFSEEVFPDTAREHLGLGRGQGDETEQSPTTSSVVEFSFKSLCSTAKQFSF